ncbi:MAG: hypothetical protein ACO1OB_02015 [Archangium sp.]
MNESKPEDLINAGIMGACCFLFGLAGIIGVVIWMMRSRSAPPPGLQGVTSPTPQQPAYAPPAADFHLSVIAIAFDTYFRPQVEAALQTVAGITDPVQMRVALVQAATKSLIGIAPQWRHFGYGEKDLNDLTSAQQSYQHALTDFRERAEKPGDGGALAVLTIILCTRGRRLGVSRLDTRQQIHELLADRLLLSPGTLLGAELVWAPQSGSVSEPVARERFPEMHVVAL